MMQKRRLFLASKSPRRKQILEEAKIPFTCIPNLLDHEPERPSDRSAADWVQHLATLKVKASSQDFEGLICGSDTMVVLNDVDYGKPKDKAEAAEFLSKLVGKTHQVLTAIALLDTIEDQLMVAMDTVDVTMNPLTSAEIATYIDSYDVLDKAGAYGIQFQDSGLIERYIGSYDTVMGFPFERLCELLENYDIL